MTPIDAVARTKQEDDDIIIVIRSEQKREKWLARRNNYGR